MSAIATRTPHGRLKARLPRMVDWTARWAAPAALLPLVVIGAVLSTQDTAVVVVAAAVGLGAAIAGAEAARWWLLAASSTALLAVAAACTGSTANLGWFAVCVLAAWCSLRGGTTIGVAFTAVATVVFIGEWTLVEADLGWAPWIAGTVFTTVVCLMARRQRELVDQLRAAQAGLADRARAEERNRIARELHDVIGHALTVSLLHVTSARLALDEDPSEAAASLAEAERLGQQSLAEVRAAVGLLRDVDGSAMTPMPGADDLPELVESFRRAGVPIDCELVGEHHGLTAALGLTTYRILQEALTNVARHAPGARTRVLVSMSNRRIELTVESAGRPGVRNRDGVGLHSMRERAEALGGSASAGPSATGWRVHAVLPGCPEQQRAVRR